MHPLAQGLVALALLAAIPAHSDSRTLSCDQAEAAALNSAPPGVHRLSADRLNIEGKTGAQSFVNAAVRPGGVRGTEFRYCGSALGYHLIARLEDALFTGVLLDAASGNLLPAGRIVTFSPDASRYFAIQHPSGLDGEEWRVYSRAGRELWKGESGLAKAREANWEYYTARLDQPRWSVAGELEATFRCSSGPPKMATVTLRASGRGYVWEPRMECAP